MYVGNNIEVKSLLCLSGSTITGEYKIIGTTKVNEEECVVLSEEYSSYLEVVTVKELSISKI